MSNTRRTFLAGAAAGLAAPLAALSLPAARAQAPASGLPAGPIRLVVAYATGGGADYTARLIAAKLQDTAGVNVIVENRPGASGIIGTDVVARAPADGLTLLYADAGHGINPAVNSRARYRPVDDFTPLTLIASSPQVLAAHPSLPANTFAELLAMPRERSRQLAVATTGQGSGPHLTYELLRVRTGLELVHVPYKGGGPAINDAIGGQVPLVMNSAPALMPHLQAGRLKALGIAAAKRSPRLPDVPTFAESAPGVVAINWYGVLAPAGLPAELAERFAAAIAKAVALPDVQEKFAAAFLDPMPMGTAAFGRFLGDEVRQWKEVATQTGTVVE